MESDTPVWLPTYQSESVKQAQAECRLCRAGVPFKATLPVKFEDGQKGYIHLSQKTLDKIEELSAKI